MSAILALALALAAPRDALSGPASDATSCGTRATALGQIACELARQLPKSEHATLVVATPVVTTLKAERLERLAADLARLTAGELGPSARASDRPTPSLELHRLGKPVTRLVVLTPELARDKLSVGADVIASLPRFWERMRGVAPSTTARAFATRPLDAELNSYLPPIPLVISRVDKAALEEPSVALGCGDIDGDGALEIVAVGRYRVALGRVEKGRFVALASKPWTELSEVAPSPLREALGSVSIATPRAFDVGISDRRDMLRLDATLAVVGRFGDRIPWPGGGCARREGLALGGVRAACAAGASAKAVGNEPIDAIAGLRLGRADGSVLEVFARHKQRDGRLEIDIGGRTLELPEPVGAQVALADLDGNGTPELLTTSAALDPAADFVRVRSLHPNGGFDEAFRLPVPSGVRALGVCPREGDGLTPIVVGTGDGLWIVR